jgi:hypothetical protein
MRKKAGPKHAAALDYVHHGSGAPSPAPIALQAKWLRCLDAVDLSVEQMARLKKVLAPVPKRRAEGT